MGIDSTFRHLLSALLLSAIAGGVAYALTNWLAPPSVSAFTIGIIVAVIAALAILAPSVVLRVVGRTSNKVSSKPDTYYGYGFSMTKDEGWND